MRVSESPVKGWTMNVAKKKSRTHLLIMSALTSTSSPAIAPLRMSAFCWLKYVTNSGP